MGYAEELEYWSSMGLTGLDREVAAGSGVHPELDEEDDCDNEEEETDGIHDN